MKNLEYTIFLYRHGETDWNNENRLQGQLPTCLNRRGKRQAEKLGKILETENLEILYSSDLKRAQETSQIVAKKINLGIVYHPGLREISLGQAQGCLESDLVDKFGEISYRNWKDQSDKSDFFRFPDGESKLEAEARAIQAIRDLLKNNPYRRIGICSHGFILKRLHRFLEEGPISETKIQNCEIRKFRISVESLNKNINNIKDQKFFQM